MMIIQQLPSRNHMLTAPEHCLIKAKMVLTCVSFAFHRLPELDCSINCLASDFLLDCTSDSTNYVFESFLCQSNIIVWPLQALFISAFRHSLAYSFHTKPVECLIVSADPAVSSFFTMKSLQVRKNPLPPHHLAFVYCILLLLLYQLSR